MTQAEFDGKVKEVLRERVDATFCEVCGAYSSKKHQGVWCGHCPGKMRGYKMTWAGCMIKAKPHGTGWYNGLWGYMSFYKVKEFNPIMAMFIRGQVSEC